MTVLTKVIAQDIVDQTMRILTYNINVMDEGGVIIGSGDQSRIGEMREGATNVIAQKRRVDIAVDQTQKLAGTKPGINLPIVFEDKIVGVIGISGDPNGISQFGELVKMGAEMSLKQAALTEQLQWDDRLREEVITQIIHDKVDSLSEERAHRLGIDLTVKRLPILLELIPHHMKEEEISELKKQALAYLQGYLGEKDLVANSGPTRIIILKSQQPHLSKTGIIKEFQDVIRIIKERISLTCHVGIGMEFHRLEDAQQAYEYAASALGVGKILYPDDLVYDYEEFLLPILLSQLNTKGHKLTDYYETLVAYDKSGELQTTLQLYIEQHDELNETAQKLHIHRNTLRYRLDKIASVTGKDPRKTKDLLKLHISQLLYQLK